MFRQFFFSLFRRLFFQNKAAGAVVSAVIVTALMTMANSSGQADDTMLWGPFSKTYALKVFQSELEKPLLDGTRPKVDILPFSLPPQLNPFNVADVDFKSGTYFSPKGQTAGPIPEIDPQDATWFTMLADQNICPKFLIIAGHNVISHGWHNDAETEFLFLPTLLKTVAKYPDAKNIFACVKVAVLFGCNTLTNLEPHKANGENYTQEEMKALYESGPEGRRAVIGRGDINNTLEFYKDRLAREYGSTQPMEEYDYYRDASLKECFIHIPYKGRDHIIENLDCVMPETGLFDGTHRYNYPYMMKHLFPNARLILGFSSASPSNLPASHILQVTFDKARAEVNKGKVAGSGSYRENILYPLSDDTTDFADKARIIESIRKFWSIDTYQMNRGRPSGSITPVFPELDHDGIIPEAARLVIHLNNPPAYGPYDPDLNGALSIQRR